MRRDEASGRTARDGRSLTVLLAVASLVAALVFNGFQLRNSAKQIQQSQQSFRLQKRSSDFATLIAVSSTLERSHAQISDIISHPEQRSSTAGILGIIAALRPNEPIAFALNRGLVDVPGATGFWGNLLFCNLQFAEQSPSVARRLPRYFPELVSFVESGSRRDFERSCL